MNILTPAIPKRLTVTQTMMEDFLCDPVLAAKVILGLDLDAFQKCRLRYMWWVPELIDCSGFSSGKTIVDWAYIQLRCILIPEHDAGVYYPVFETGKNTFWPYYTKIFTPIFQAHLGNLDEKGEEASSSKIHGAACFKAFYRNGSKVMMPAPSFMKQAATQASMRFNTLLVEEWTHIDAASEGINMQLMGRVTKECYNQHHPIWANHKTFTAPAKTQMHPGFHRFSILEKRARRGEPDAAVIRYCYKDYSDLKKPSGKSYREAHRDYKTIATMKANLARADFLGECLGIWSRSGKGWFTEDSILSCIEIGRRRGIVPITSKRQEEKAVWN